jgi:hypothetical protein
MVTTKMIWNSDTYMTNRSLVVAKEAFITSMINAGKTDGEHVEVNDVCTTRTWVDQAAADEWTTFITNAAIQYGYSVTVTII